MVQTCYAKWSSICSGYYEFNALVLVHYVEWNCHYFFLFICRILVFVLLVLPYYMMNKDEYNIRSRDADALFFAGLRLWRLIAPMNKLGNWLIARKVFRVKGVKVIARPNAYFFAAEASF